MNFGGDEEDRTPDLRIANATLSQLSYAPTDAAKFITGPARGRPADPGKGIGERAAERAAEKAICRGQ